MYTFFKTTQSTLNDKLSAIGGKLIGAMAFAAKHPTAFALISFYNIVQHADACYMIYCKFQYEDSLNNIPQLPSNLTEWCIEHSGIQPPSAFLSADSMDIGGFCNLKCR